MAVMPWDLNLNCFHATKFLELMVITALVLLLKIPWREKEARMSLD